MASLKSCHDLHFEIRLSKFIKDVRALALFGVFLSDEASDDVPNPEKKSKSSIRKKRQPSGPEPDI